MKRAFSSIQQMGCGSSSARSYTIGAPTAAVEPAGKCFFGEEWKPAKMTQKVPISHNTRVFTFALPPETPLGLSTCACILARGGADKDGAPLVRPYTPVSTNKMLGQFELMVKIYDGGLSKHMDSMELEDSLEFKHIPFNVKTQYPFGMDHIGMIVGGTGITPMIQALHALLGTPEDKTKISLLFGNRSEEDILCRQTLESWADKFKDRLTVTHVLSHESSDTWKGEKGFINQQLVEKHMPAPAGDTGSSQIWICGPPPMYEALCGARGEEGVSGLLGEMGYPATQVYKF